jgi:hypothetical protein
MCLHLLFVWLRAGSGSPFLWEGWRCHRSLWKQENVLNLNLIGILRSGVQLDPLGTAVTNRPIVSAPGDCDDGEIGGMIGRGNRSTRRNPGPMPLCPPQTPHAARTRTRVAEVPQRLTVWATSRPRERLNVWATNTFLGRAYLFKQ